MRAYRRRGSVFHWGSVPFCSLGVRSFFVRSKNTFTYVFDPFLKLRPDTTVPVLRLHALQ